MLAIATGFIVALMGVFHNIAQERIVLRRRINHLERIVSQIPNVDLCFDDTDRLFPVGYEPDEKCPE